MKSVLGAALVGATLLLAPTVSLAAECNNAVKSAMQCPSGYTMMCATDGYERWVCAKTVNGVSVPLGSGIPDQKHDTIEISKSGIPAKKPVALPSKVPTAAKPQAIQKPLTIVSATSSYVVEKKEDGWFDSLGSYIRHIFGGTATSTKHSTSSPPFLSNAYFKNVIRVMFGK